MKWPAGLPVKSAGLKQRSSAWRIASCAAGCVLANPLCRATALCALCAPCGRLAALLYVNTRPPVNSPSVLQLIAQAKIWHSDHRSFSFWKSMEDYNSSMRSAGCFGGAVPFWRSTACAGRSMLTHVDPSWSNAMLPLHCEGVNVAPLFPWRKSEASVTTDASVPALFQTYSWGVIIALHCTKNIILHNENGHLGVICMIYDSYMWYISAPFQTPCDIKLSDCGIRPGQVRVYQGATQGFCHARVAGVNCVWMLPKIWEKAWKGKHSIAIDLT